MPREGLLESEPKGKTGMKPIVLKFRLKSRAIPLKKRG